MPNLIGQSLGRYRITEQLGEGGMATVYKAYDTRLERDVAVKIIRREAFPPDQLERILKRFEREAKALAKLSHPNIVGVIDYGDFEGSPYLVMEFLPSGTLKQLLGKPIPWREVVRLLLPVARALQFAHGQGIIHRDIKPSNILITLSREPMLADFGIAKILEGGETATLTGTGIGIGTPEYMAPEQWVGKVIPQSDIYSLGMVMYEMITGCKPYIADTPAAILLKQATEPLPRPVQYVPNLPEVVEKVLLKALARRPEDRYLDMAAFAKGLDHLLSTQSPGKDPIDAGKAVASKAKSNVETQATVMQVETPSPSISETTHSEKTTEQPATAFGRKNSFQKFRWLMGILIVAIVIGVMIFSASGIISPGIKSPGLVGGDATDIIAPTLTDTKPPAEIISTTPADTPVPTVDMTKPVTITWWHISTANELRELWQNLADEYTALHPNVTIEIQVLENEPFKNMLATAMQNSNPPDIFQSWGGGVMGEYAKAGMLKDISADLDFDGGTWRNSFGKGALGVYAYNDVNYGVPWDMGMIGWWYNKALFRQAGIVKIPATWTEFSATVTKLKAAGITPIALGEGDRWTGAFLWEYLVTRIGGKANFEKATNGTGAFTDEPFVEAGSMLQELVAMRPFQNGYMSANYGNEAAAMGNGKAAMELMGQWAPGVMKSGSDNKLGIGSNLGWFPFPMVEGGAGDPSDALGGGNGFAVGKNASPEAVDFVKYLTRIQSQAQCASIGSCIPVVRNGEVYITDPLMITLYKEMANAEYIQLYYDQALTPKMGSVINDTVYALFAVSITPKQAAQTIENSAKQEIR